MALTTDTQHSLTEAAGVAALSGSPFRKLAQILVEIQYAYAVELEAITSKFGGGSPATGVQPSSHRHLADARSQAGGAESETAGLAQAMATATQGLVAQLAAARDAYTAFDIDGLDEDTDPDESKDFLAVHDASLDKIVKVLLSNVAAATHTIASHSDTTGTGAELEELTDGSETTLHSHAGGGGGAPTDAQYVALATDATLTDERVLTAGDGIALDDAGAGSTVTARTRSTCDITAVTGVGTITDKSYEADTVPGDKILTAFKSDNDDITLTVEIHGATDAWQPADVTVSGGGATPVPVTKGNWTQVASTRIWTASVNLTDAGTTGIITATMSDGDTATVDYTRELDPPLVTAVAFDTHAGTTGGDALVDAAQTETTSVDGTQTVRLTGTTEAHATKIWVTNAGVSSSEQGPFDVTAGAFDFTINVRSSGNTGAQTATVECAVGVSGTRGATSNTSNTVTVSHTIPTFSGGAQSDIAYPATQEALKDVETCSVTVTHTNAAGGDTHLYDNNSTGELTIPSTTTYSATKASVARLSGNYRESGTNYRLTATRPTLNGTSATKSVTVKIAHTAPALTVTPTTRFGTDDGTVNYKDRTITLTSSQANLSTHTATMTSDAGDTSAFTGSWASSGSLAYTRSFRVEDADINTGGQAANNFTWATVSVKNRAGKETTTVSTNPDYSIGGFAKRTLTLAAWPNREADIGCFVVATGSLTAEALSKGGGGPGGGTVQTFSNAPGEGSTPTDAVDTFCISDGADLVDSDNQYYYNNDLANAESNTSGTAQVDIEETA